MITVRTLEASNTTKADSGCGKIEETQEKRHKNSLYEYDRGP